MPTMSDVHIGEMSNAERETARWWSQLNIGLAGDVGPYTCWTTKRKKLVIIRRAPPDHPASARQLKQRLRFRLSWMHWKAEPQDIKDKWTKLCGHASLCMSGHNLYMSQCMKPTPEQLMNAAADMGITIEMPPWVPA